MSVINGQSGLFSILSTVDSSNNYATGQVHAGLAKHGQTWFALEQTAGKGQRGKTWISAPGENLMMSIAIRPGKAFAKEPFLLSMLTANICREILAEISEEKILIKWPNDLYWRDRKTGGILIENIYKGQILEWSVIGIGININQTDFGKEAGGACSLKQICGKENDPVAVAKLLWERLLEKIDQPGQIEKIPEEYNLHLYKSGEKVKLKKENAVFETTVTGVNIYGQLLTEDSMERSFEVGEVIWQIPG